MTSVDLAQVPQRLATGAFILNSGLQKWSGDEQTAAGVHGMAAGTYPFVKNVDPPTFLKGLAAGEIALGSALLTPFVPGRLAGVALVGFAGSLLGLYVRTPGMHDGNLRPTQQGTPIAKDIWMLGIGAALVLGGRNRRRDEKIARKAEKKALKVARQEAKAEAKAGAKLAV
ncbi:hypothetical protein Acsp06_44030 [Actinomycetospora sp. NBRC 106375]|uniref:hypothetical protein n=1 Tax=Actinomycetospora sp. NBRC 106375 TaxID=3032207 RepID=UPI0024A26BD2|nr:hypothetical protein [Actinomycetospora sp. NBRC 106375]GLZ48218.1 hypothetical protein Acsp06_44030 [Actinomycetospora sp. NBRC 106375]